MARKRSLISLPNASAVRDRQVLDFPPRNSGDVPRSDTRKILLLTERNSPELLDFHRHAGGCPPWSNFNLANFPVPRRDAASLPYTTTIVSRK